MSDNTDQRRLAAFGNQLIAVHIWLREELAALREGVGAWLDGGDRPTELGLHCLTFCSVLTRHHTEEDGEVFGAVAAAFPALAPVLDELRADHVLVAATVEEIKALVERLGSETETAASERIERELDTLAALLETHFVYEEKKIAAALDAIGADLLPEDAVSRVLPET